MVITYHGFQFFKIQFGDIVIAYNPISKESKYWNGGRFGADMALISKRDKDMEGIENVSFGDKKPFLILGSGEYEIKDVFITGYLSKTNYNKKEGINTIYSLILEGMNLCFLGALSFEKDIPKELFESTENIDILFLPIGAEDGLLSPEEANKVAVKLEPRIIIPMTNEKDALKKFLKESGDEDVKPTDKLTLKKKDLEGKEAEVILLSSN